MDLVMENNFITEKLVLDLEPFDLEDKENFIRGFKENLEIFFKVVGNELSCQTFDRFNVLKIFKDFERTKKDLSTLKFNSQEYGSEVFFLVQKEIYSFLLREATKLPKIIEEWNKKCPNCSRTCDKYTEVAQEWITLYTKKMSELERNHKFTQEQGKKAADFSKALMDTPA